MCNHAWLCETSHQIGTNTRIEQETPLSHKICLQEQGSTFSCFLDIEGAKIRLYNQSLKGRKEERFESKKQPTGG